jgi:hypothetical protein
MDMRYTIRFEIWFVFKAPFFGFPIHEDGDVIVAAGNLQRKEVVK